MVVLQNNHVLFERYAPDFGREGFHSTQSITKSIINLIIGRLLEQGRLSLSTIVGDIIPEIGAGYAASSLKSVLNMTVNNNFIEDYKGNPYSPEPALGEPMGYSRQEIALGWRLPPADEGEEIMSMRNYICRIGAAADNQDNSGYKSPNNDLLGWIAERASGRHLRSLVQEVVDACGFESVFHMSCDVDFVPMTSGGGFMTTRDLARLGLLFARHGVGVSGEQVGSIEFLDATRKQPQIPTPVWYQNQMMTNGQWVGHGGFGGQWMAADPESGCSVAFYSVFTPGGEVEMESVIAMAQEVFALARTDPGAK
jgi:CubicO group peptidase (beta-lactamase class C family)